MLRCPRPRTVLGVVPDPEASRKVFWVVLQLVLQCPQQVKEMETVPGEKTGPSFSSEELAEYHKKIHRHIALLRRAATDMDVVDMVYKLGNWVEMAGVDEKGDRGEKLAVMVAAFEDMVKGHFQWEEKNLLPGIEARGASEFTAKLAREHEEAKRSFEALRRKIDMFRQPTDHEKDRELEEEIKADLQGLLKKLEVHALEEEDTFFMLDHNV